MAKSNTDWPAVRERWENDPRVGYAWLIKEMGLTVKVCTVGGRRTREGWKKKVKANNGVPSKYRPEFAEHAKKMCLLMNCTNAELAAIYQVNTATISVWRSKYKDFDNAVKEGKEIADQKVVASLHHRACGYSHPHEEIKVIDNEIVRVDTVKHYPPDTAAAFIWLKNRQPGKWRDKTEQEVSVKQSMPSNAEHQDKIADYHRRADEQRRLQEQRTIVDEIGPSEESA